VTLAADWSNAPPEAAGAPAPAGAAAAVPPPPTPAPRVPAPDAVAHLKPRVKAVCGSAATEVFLFARSADNILVRFCVRDTAEGARLAAKVLAMPELAPYRIDFDVKVVR
jgi:hypothetical protein